MCGRGFPNPAIVILPTQRYRSCHLSTLVHNADRFWQLPWQFVEPRHIVRCTIHSTCTTCTTRTAAKARTRTETATLWLLPRKLVGLQCYLLIIFEPSHVVCKSISIKSGSSGKKIENLQSCPRSKEAMTDTTLYSDQLKMISNHRLWGFKVLEQTYQKSFSLPVIGLEDIYVT